MSGILSQGTVLKAGSTSTTTAIGGITNWKITGSSRTVIDSTDMSSTAKEFLIGLKDSGELTFDLNYDPDENQHAILEDAHDNATKLFFDIEYTNGNKVSFQGYVMGFEAGGAMDALVTGSVSVKISGAVTRTAAA